MNRLTAGALLTLGIAMGSVGTAVLTAEADAETRTNIHAFCVSYDGKDDGTVAVEVYGHAMLPDGGTQDLGGTRDLRVPLATMQPVENALHSAWRVAKGIDANGGN